MGRWWQRLVLVAWGALGVLAALGVLHVWQDHHNLHAVIGIVSRAPAPPAR